MPRKKSSMAPPGIDPGAFRLVAQFLYHYATPGPVNLVHSLLNTRQNFADPKFSTLAFIMYTMK
jgi:hypothetical protein